MHFNTTHATAPVVNQLRKHAESQNERIMDFFDANVDKYYTPSEIRRFVFEGSVPITSVRRGMTTLTADKRLFKTKSQRDGPYGRPEYLWRVATKQLELLM